MDPLRTALFWLDAHPRLDALMAWGAFALVAALALAPLGPRTSHRAVAPGWFVLAVGLTLAAFRWPTWFYRADFNPDEAQIIAGAITLDHFALPWKFLDPTTHGPLCEYGLVLAAKLGAPFNYAVARIAAALLQAGALLAIWATLRRVTHESVARLAILPGLAFWSLTGWEDFLHYSSELPGIFLMAWAIFFATRAAAPELPEARRTAAAFIAGAALGLVPYAKLQSVPEALLLGLVALGLAWRTASTGALRRRLCGTLAAAALLPSLLHAVYLGLFGLGAQFWYTYVVSALDFLSTGAHPLADMPGRFLNFSATVPSFAWFFWGSLGFNLLYLRSVAPVQRREVALGWSIVAVAWFTVIRPGRESVHYLHLLVIPLGLLSGLTLRAVVPPGDKSAAGLRGAFAALALFTLAPLVFEHATHPGGYRGHARAHWEAPPSEAARHILARRQAGDTLAMWGWAPHLHVETQLPHATREAQTGNQLMHWPLTEFFVDRYVRDLARAQPAWFVDAVGPGAFIFNDRRTQGHESIAALRTIIDRDYELVAEFGEKRLYHRRARP